MKQILRNSWNTTFSQAEYKIGFIDQIFNFTILRKNAKLIKLIGMYLEMYYTIDLPCR